MMEREDPFGEKGEVCSDAPATDQCESSPNSARISGRKRDRQKLLTSGGWLLFAT